MQLSQFINNYMSISFVEVNAENGLSYIAVKNEDLTKKFRHGFFTNKGGVSEGFFASLNTALHVQDNEDSVVENRKKIQQVIGEVVITANQEHTTKTIAIAEEDVKKYNFLKSESVQGAAFDALITAVPNVNLAVQSADCVSILLYCADIDHVAAIHSGWKGTLSNITSEVVDILASRGAAMENTIAIISPAIAQENYEVHDDFYKQFIDKNADYEQFFAKRDGKIYFDNKSAVKYQLNHHAIDEIYDCGIDTYSDERFFSYRRSLHGEQKGVTGRNLSFICLL